MASKKMKFNESVQASVDELRSMDFDGAPVIVAEKKGRITRGRIYGNPTLLSIRDLLTSKFGDCDRVAAVVPADCENGSDGIMTMTWERGKMGRQRMVFRDGTVSERDNLYPLTPEGLMLNRAAYTASSSNAIN